jgi:CubicO group peptidase (beta-lactamase class C family)
LKLSDPVAKYIPEFANLKTPSGKPANLTITQIMTHTSGLGEAPAADAKNAKTLTDLVPMWLAAPMQFEPVSKWSYCQSGINAGARVVEIVSGMTFDQFVQKRIFDPLGMNDMTFYPTDEQRKRMVTAYAKMRRERWKLCRRERILERKAVPRRETAGCFRRAGLCALLPDASERRRAEGEKVFER